MSAYQLEDVWGFIQQEFDQVCSEIRTILFKMKLQEIQVLNIERKYNTLKKVRKFVAKKLAEEMKKEKIPVDFNTNQKEVFSLLEEMSNRGKRWRMNGDNYKLIEEKESVAVEKYQKGWKGKDYLMIKNWTRRKRRLLGLGQFKVE